jgi:hypothetical protein
MLDCVLCILNKFEDSNKVEMVICNEFGN